MEYRQLGRTDLNVSALCLGTMTWGEQNVQDEAFKQIAMAKAAGVNFIDTAEMYPVPPRPETYAATERIIGNWFREQGDRDEGPKDRFGQARECAGQGCGFSSDHATDDLEEEEAEHHEDRDAEQDVVDLHVLVAGDVD